MKYLFLSLIFAFALPVHAEFKTADEAIQKLKSYKASDFKDDAKKEAKNETTKESEMFDDLSDAVKFAEKNKPSAEFLEALTQATVVALDQDNSWYAGEVVLPTYKKYKKDFEKALKKLPKKDAANVEESIKNKEREAKSGNG